MKKLLVIIFIGFALYGFLDKNPNFIQSYSGQGTRGDEQLTRAYQGRKSDLQVTGSGIVIRVLPDDTKGSQHQKFILRLSSGQTLLMSHNIDLAPRINSLRKGDLVEFYGEYEWNSKGGIVHWTHHDPDGHHVSGWLKHKGTTYQ